MNTLRFSVLSLLIVGILFTSCKKNCDDHSVAVNAGNYQSIQLPTDSITLTGIVKSGSTLSINYLWTLISGPGTPVFVNKDSAKVSIKSMVAGTYTFQFQAKNSYGQVGLDTVSVTVIPANIIIKTLTLQPANNSYEGIIDNYWPTLWLQNGQILVAARSCIKFDYSGIPSGATIDSAKLLLYSDPNPLNGDLVNAQSGTANACYVQRITSNWVMPNPFTWNKQPAYTTVNQAVIPQSTSSAENDTTNVTSLVKDMLTYGNNGFFIQLQNEVIYNVRQYVSSTNTNSTLYPKLVITYH